jgi:RNA polymerase sigma-70 factor (ECF subfamily)
MALGSTAGIHPGGLSGGAVVTTHPSKAIGVAPAVTNEAAKVRFERFVADHYGFVWRSARRLGVREADLDDVVQEVFLAAGRSLDTIESERGYLFQTCVFVAARARRTTQRRREVNDEERLNEQVDQRARPDEHAEANEARERLQILLDDMPEELRVVFVLFELERFTMSEISESLNIPMGTVASRLRRGRELFMEKAARANRRGGR